MPLKNPARASSMKRQRRERRVDDVQLDLDRAAPRSRCTRAASTCGRSSRSDSKNSSGCRSGRRPHGRGVGVAQLPEQRRGAQPDRPVAIGERALGERRRASSPPYCASAVERGQPRGVGRVALGRARTPRRAAARRPRVCVSPIRRAAVARTHEVRRLERVEQPLGQVGRADPRQRLERRALHADVVVGRPGPDRAPAAAIGGQRRRGRWPAPRARTSRGSRLETRHDAAGTRRDRAAPPPSAPPRASRATGSVSRSSIGVERPRGRRWRRARRPLRAPGSAACRRRRAASSSVGDGVGAADLTERADGGDAQPHVAVGTRGQRDRGRRRRARPCGRRDLAARTPACRRRRSTTSVQQRRRGARDRRCAAARNATGHQRETGCPCSSSATRASAS